MYSSALFRSYKLVFIGIFITIFMWGLNYVDNGCVLSYLSWGLNSSHENWMLCNRETSFWRSTTFYKACNTSASCVDNKTLCVIESQFSKANLMSKEPLTWLLRQSTSLEALPHVPSSGSVVTCPMKGFSTVFQWQLSIMGGIKILDLIEEVPWCLLCTVK